jgi:Protein of unknown function (DUF2589)
MPREVDENAALNLYQLIGAPLQALVQAEVQAAQATAEFVERVGFEKKRDTPQDENAIGDLRVTSFRQQRVGPDGKLQTYNVDIPLLSLVPIPLMQIKNAELDFAVRILEAVETEKPDTLLQRKPAGKGDTQAEPSAGGTLPSENFLTAPRVEMKAALTRRESDTVGARRTETQIRVKVNIEQADIPAGILKLLNLMDQSVNVRPEQKQAAK